MDKVILLGKGYSELLFRNSKNRPEADELWVVNSLGFHYRDADKLFRMDDLRAVPPKEHQDEFMKKDCKMPIFTSKAYEEYPTSVDYPLREILEYLGDNELAKKQLRSTVAFALIYAEYLGVKEIECHGVDLGENPQDLSYSAAYMLGRLDGKGIKVKLSQGSKLHNIPSLPEGSEYYGYHKEN